MFCDYGTPGVPRVDFHQEFAACAKMQVRILRDLRGNPLCQFLIGFQVLRTKCRLIWLST